jgi:hypothetical protein
MKRGEEPTRIDLLSQGGAAVLAPDSSVCPVAVMCERAGCCGVGEHWDGCRWLCSDHYQADPCPSRVQQALWGHQSHGIQVSHEEGVAGARARHGLPSSPPSAEDRLRAENDHLRVSYTRLRLELRDTRIVAVIMAIFVILMGVVR